MKFCPHCPVNLTELTRKERRSHREYHSNGRTWGRSVASQDAKPSLPRVEYSREETRQAHLGWSMR